MRHTRFAHGQKPEVVDEMLYAWIEKHMGVVGSDLHMDERLMYYSSRLTTLMPISHDSFRIKIVLLLVCE